MADDEMLVSGDSGQFSWLFELDKELFENAIDYHQGMVDGHPVMIPMPSHLLSHMQRFLASQGSDTELPDLIVDSMVMWMSALMCKLAADANKAGKPEIAERLREQMRRKRQVKEQGSPIILS